MIIATFKGVTGGRIPQTVESRTSGEVSGSNAEVTPPPAPDEPTEVPTVAPGAAVGEPMAEFGSVRRSHRNAGVD